MNNLETKFTRIYETEDCVSTWKYDTSFSKTNPISVEHKWKKPVQMASDKKKTLGDLVSETKKTKSKKIKS